MKILMTGATGFVGRALALRLAREGHQLVVLSRDAARAKLEVPAPCEAYAWDYRQGPPPAAAYAGVEAIVHLAGESIASGRWTEKRKKEILDSRVVSARHLRQGAKGRGIETYVSASATGIYGDRGDEELTETSLPGQGFLAEVCVAWEAEAAKDPFAREVHLRTGVVLGQGGGALEKLVPLFSNGLGGTVGSGRQWFPWIHLDDLVSMYAQALTSPQWRGAVNAVAPEPVRYGDFARALGRQLHRPAWLPAPALALKVALGEMSSALLGSQKVVPARARELGFNFAHPTLASALTEVLGAESEGDSTLRATQWIPAPVEKVFEFFSLAENLERITPPFLGFKVVRQEPAELGNGTLIDYRLSLHGLSLGWRSRISEWKTHERFVDDQLKGPYAKWHHLHTFEALGGGTLVGDEVRYRLPLGFLGKATAGGFVSADVGKIFAYRRKIIGEVFKAQ
jgi:uncharacterized protein (TIGR01777 family)